MRKKVVSAEGQTRTNEAKITVLFFMSLIEFLTRNFLLLSIIINQYLLTSTIKKHVLKNALKLLWK